MMRANMKFLLFFLLFILPEAIAQEYIYPTADPATVQKAGHFYQYVEAAGFRTPNRIDDADIWASTDHSSHLVLTRNADVTSP